MKGLPEMPKLYIYPKEGEASIFALQNKQITVGRLPDNDIVVAEQFCSSRHAVIFPTESGYSVLDNHSKNGTFVNGKRIQSETALKRGDEILIGLTRIIFDKELVSSVEVIDPSPSEAINTIIQVKDFLRKPQIATTLDAPAIVLDINKLKAEHRALAILNEVSQSLVYHQPLDQLLEHIMDLVSHNLPLDRGVLMLMEGNPAQLIPRAIRIKDSRLADKNIQVSRTIINTVMSKNSSVLIYDALSETQFRFQASIVQSKIRSAMCVPLWNNQEIIGIIYADRRSLAAPFSEDDLKLLTLVANLAAVKIENAKLIEQAIEKGRMDRELALAAQIQKNFLPKENPKFENYDIAGTNLTCCTVGGDYYDFIPVGPERLGIVIADVAGNGMSASLLMASLRAALHSEVHPDYSAEAMTVKLNDFVHSSSSSDRFITFFFGELEKASGALSYINAGHNPPILFRHEGGIERLESCGFCLGMFPSVRYEEKKTSLRPGDLVLFYTDGITESRNKSKEEFDEHRVIAVLQKHGHRSAQEIMDLVLEELKVFTECTDPADDMTLVIVKRVH